jgi:uncharacterized protein YaaR (DUF327 family)
LILSKPCHHFTIILLQSNIQTSLQTPHYSDTLISMIDDLMREKLNRLSEQLSEMEKRIADPSLVKDKKNYKKVMQEFSHISETLEAYSYRSSRRQKHHNGSPCWNRGR